MNISSTPPKYIMYIILAILGFLSNFYILSAPQCPLGRLIFHSAGFSPCSVARLPGVIRIPSKHGGTSMKTAVMSKMNFCLLQTHLFSEGLCLSMSHNARWYGFCCCTND